VAGAGEVTVQLPEATPSGPLRAAQAAELLRAYVAGAREVEVEVTVARSLDAERAYVEIRRVFAVRGAGAPHTQTVYLGLRRTGSSFRVAEVRVVP
jgi:DNA replicative helicase MCM subunit Mcm2 (Cdc46/Mcm family)